VLAIRNRHALPDGGVLDVSEFDYRTAAACDSKAPASSLTKSFSLTRADIYSRRDRALELAKKIC
jgi:hypothetical protein